MESIISQAQAIARIVVQDKVQFEQSKWVAQKFFGFARERLPGVSRGVLVLAILLLFKALIETTFSQQTKKH